MPRRLRPARSASSVRVKPAPPPAPAQVDTREADAVLAPTLRCGRRRFSAHNVTHNAGSHLSRNSPNSRRSPPHVVFGKVHKYNILWLASLTKASEFHLYYDI